ncbi:MAG: hypothetical protein ETSY2_08335 [Candidatus Entotheonella gemina]|uniref:Uncharacterized protein n=1 Tax=Candidatus Entotheonella gemina TaxID=1429439 RepID=W4MCM2_9BACT|nr:MAG: hypothetical protein ETSY2_08335 [Candidatus Entotheonella gemina]
MTDRDRPEFEEGHQTRQADAIGNVARALCGERIASYELINAFLPGKQLYMGLPEPYQFVEAPESGDPGLQLASCPCPVHQGRTGTHILNMSEVSLVLECGSDRVWVFITIPARHRSKYAWLPSVAFGSSVDEELCGRLASVPSHVQVE